MSIGRNIADFCIALYERFGFPFRRRDTTEKPKPSFVLVGPSGVGKTQITRSVEGDLSNLMSTPERTYQSRTIYIDTEEGQLVFFDTPGHREGEDSRNAGLRSAAVDGEYGVILVAAFGYHESISIAKPEIKNGKVTPEWLAKNREREMNVFHMILHRAMIIKKPRIIITLVNKADLWRDDWNDVKEFYTQADYSQEAANAGIQHEIMQYCVLPKKFWALDNPQLQVDVGEATELHDRLNGLLRQFLEGANDG